MITALRPTPVPTPPAATAPRPAPPRAPAAEAATDRVDLGAAPAARTELPFATVLGAGGVAGWLAAVLSHVPFLGIESPDRGEPALRPLGFSWREAPDFPERMQACERLLEDPAATVVAKRQLCGSNGVFVVTLSNGVTGIWKPDAMETRDRVRPQVPPGRQSERERAAYLVDRRLGHLARVPPCVQRKLEGKPGVLTLLVPETRSARKWPDRQALLASLPSADRRAVALFDHVVGNLDRHGGNWLLDPQGRVVPIDHGLCFPIASGRQGTTVNFDFSEPVRLTLEERCRLQGLLSHCGELEPLLGGPAVQAMRDRVSAILQTGATSDAWRCAT